DHTTGPGTYLYQIHEVDANGAERYTNTVELHYGTNGIYFSQPYPNPYVLSGTAGEITLNFELPARDNVLVRIYNIDGTLLRTLLDRPLDGGPHSLTWDARDAGGNLVAPGAYLCSIQTGQSGTVTNKIMVVRE
ncbi:MAG: FlgD immunoglobulin-like domain containing protein, partial [Candidatus Kapaibacterium sp.]